jgi:hypothetical protein
MTGMKKTNEMKILKAVPEMKRYFKIFYSVE